MDLNNLWHNKLWMVTGKGGVGKTTLAGALGLLSAQRGEDTLLVETHGLNHLGELLGVPDAGYNPKRVFPGLWLCQITAEKALEEYLLQQIKVRMIYNAVFKNRYVRHFMDAAPGLVELLTIGKVWALTQPKGQFGNKRSFHRVIVDAPATGHGIGMMRVPEVVKNAVRIGPLKTKSERILNLVRDPKKTSIWMATLPEDLPVTETTEMREKLIKEVQVHLGPILVNGIWPDLVSSETIKDMKAKKLAYPPLKIFQKRSDLSHYYLDKLKTNLPDETLWELPLIYKTSEPLKVAQALMSHLKGYFEQEFAGG